MGAGGQTESDMWILPSDLLRGVCWELTSEGLKQREEGEGPGERALTCVWQPLRCCLRRCSLSWEGSGHRAALMDRTHFTSFNKLSFPPPIIKVG